MKRTILLVLILTLVFLLGSGFLHKKSDLYKNMVNSSVVIHASGGFGSGVFIDDNVILTAAHVLEVADNFVIELNDGTILRSNDVYIDTEEDVGFLFVDADELAISKVTGLCGDIGDDVYLVGTPYDLDFKFTITSGILSHLDRDMYPWEDLLQTDAEGAPGSSGGPLYDANGRVIGICVSGAMPGGGVTLCESGKSILEAYERCMKARTECR